MSDKIKIAESVTKATTADLKEATWTALRAAFGNDAEAALQAAQRFVARDARVGRIIDAMGLGNDAETVVMLAQAARRSVKAR